MQPTENTLAQDPRVKVFLPDPDEIAPDRRTGFEGEVFPVWHPAGLGDVAVAQHPGIVEARWSGVTMWSPTEARAVAAALLAAARIAEEG